jgi:hypothetical protein
MKAEPIEYDCIRFFESAKKKKLIRRHLHKSHSKQFRKNNLLARALEALLQPDEHSR